MRFIKNIAGLIKSLTQFGYHYLINTTWKSDLKKIHWPYKKLKKPQSKIDISEYISIESDEAQESRQREKLLLKYFNDNEDDITFI